MPAPSTGKDADTDHRRTLITWFVNVKYTHFYVI
jgi:hypothetical protein